MRSIKLVEILGGTVSDARILKDLAIKLGIPAKTQTDVLAAYRDYRAKKGSNTIASLDLAPPWPDTFSNLYETRTQASGLDWIAKIAKTTRYGYCPMCGSETHKTVDHFLPRSPWAEFSFLSLNLVPSCSTCNTKRGNRANSPSSPLRALHPYYDHKLLNQRLHITKILPPFTGPTFEVGICSTVTPRSRRRVEHHLNHSIDSVEYQQFCSNRWSEVRLQVRRCSTLVQWKKRLKEDLEDAEATSGPNSWRTAFFSGLAARSDAIAWLFKNKDSG